MRKVCPFHESWRVELGKDTCKLEIEVWEFSSRGSQHHWGTKPGLTFICFLFSEFFTLIYLIWNLIYNITPSFYMILLVQTLAIFGTILECSLGL